MFLIKIELFEEELHKLPEDIRARFTKNAESMELDDKIAVLGEIAIMLDENVSDEEIIEYINDLLH